MRIVEEEEEAGQNGRDVVLLLNSSTLVEMSSLSPVSHKHFRGVEAFDSSQHQIFSLISCYNSSPAVPSPRGWHLGPCSPLLLQSALPLPLGPGGHTWRGEQV